MSRFASLGAALDDIGRAAAPSAPMPRPSRSLSQAPLPHPAPFRSEYESVSGFDLIGAVTIEEAMIDRGRAVEWRQEAPMFGRVVGLAAGVSLGAWLGRRMF